MSGQAARRSRRPPWPHLANRAEKGSDMPKYIAPYFQARLMLDEMITKRYRLDGVNDAFEAMRGPGV